MDDMDETDDMAEMEDMADMRVYDRRDCRSDAGMESRVGFGLAGMEGWWNGSGGGRSWLSTVGERMSAGAAVSSSVRAELSVLQRVPRIVVRTREVRR